MTGKAYACGCGRTHASWWGLHVKAPNCGLTDSERAYESFMRLMRQLQGERA